jgi:hypothetical protein
VAVTAIAESAERADDLRKNPFTSGKLVG